MKDLPLNADEQVRAWAIELALGDPVKAGKILNFVRPSPPKKAPRK